MYSLHFIFINIKNVLFLVYLNSLYNLNFMLFLLFLFTFALYNNKNMIMFFNLIVLKKIKSYIFYFYINVFIFLFLNLFYINYLFYINLNYIFFKIFYSYKFINLRIDNTINFDFINFYFLFLTNIIFLFLFLVFTNLKYKKDLNMDLKSMVCLLFFIEIFVILTFVTSNFFFFFFFFECSLIPMYLLVQIFSKGVKKKQYASYMLVFFTLLGSIFLLFGIIYLALLSNSFDFKSLSFELIDLDSQLFLFIFFFIGFSVKAPIFPFYSWLPEAHVEASTTVSILLAAIFLKVSTYGFIKIIIFNFYFAVIYFNSIVLYFSIISIFIASFLSLIQTDLKKVIALSSIIHMNYMVISIFSLDCKSILGSLVYMFAHALVSSSLFYIIGYYYDNSGSRDLYNVNNSFNYSSKLSFYFILFNLANISFPITVSFISEIMIFNNLVFYNVLILFFLTFSIFFSAIYTFWLIHNLLFGKNFFNRNYFVINKFDMYFLNFMLFMVIILGALPSIILFNIEQEIYLVLVNKLFLN